MRPEIKRSLRKALSIALIFASLFVIGRAKWPIPVALLIVAFFMLGDDDASQRPPQGRNQ